MITDNDFLNYMRDLNLLSITFRILMAMAVGGILGIERGRRHRPAGFRTYMLVSVGATLVMLTNQYAFVQFNSSDVVRMGSQVVSGIGFLGAGTIIITRRNQVKGMTTAAGLWAAGCSGLAIGIGFYEGALLGGLAIFIIMAFMQHLDDYIQTHSKRIDLYIEFEENIPFASLRNFLHNNQYVVLDVQSNKTRYDRAGKIINSATVQIKSLTKRTHSVMLEEITKAPGVVDVDEL